MVHPGINGVVGDANRLSKPFQGDSCLPTLPVEVISTGADTNRVEQVQCFGGRSCEVQMGGHPDGQVNRGKPDVSPQTLGK